MARGWESKAVEDQIEAQRGAAKAKPEGKRRELSPEEATRMRERESLQLSKTRVLLDLQAATNPKYREMLMSGLAHLEKRLAEMDGSGPKV